jgi:hypothetical protein
VRIPLNVITCSGIVIMDSGDRDRSSERSDGFLSAFPSF